MRIRHQITHRMMYGFAFIRVQCGPLEEKTEMTVARVGSNLKQPWFGNLSKFLPIILMKISSPDSDLEPKH